jgi:hypothetical protein
MPKAGRYEFPTRDLDDCVDYLQKAYEKTKSDVMKRESFAEAIELSVKGGGFGLLVSSMAMYKLIETGGGDIRYTELAKLALHGEPHERANARERAVRNITLLADIYDKLGADVTEEQIRIFLREKAIVEVSEASNLAIAIGKLFKNSVQYLTPLKEGGKRSEGGERMRIGIPTLQLRGSDYGDITITDELSADFAANIIAQFKAKLASTQATTTTTQEQNVES